MFEAAAAVGVNIICMQEAWSKDPHFLSMAQDSNLIFFTIRNTDISIKTPYSGAKLK